MTLGGTAVPLGRTAQDSAARCSPLSVIRSPSKTHYIVLYINDIYYLALSRKIVMGWVLFVVTAEEQPQVLVPGGLRLSGLRPESVRLSPCGYQ